MCVMHAVFTRKEVSLSPLFEQMASTAMQPQIRTPELTSFHSQPLRSTSSTRHPISDGLHPWHGSKQVVRPTAAAAGHPVYRHEGPSGDKKSAFKLSNASVNIRERDERLDENTVRAGGKRRDMAGGRWLHHGDGGRGDLEAAWRRLRWQDSEAALQRSRTGDESRPQGLNRCLQQHDQCREEQLLGHGPIRHHGSIQNYDHRFAARELLFASTSMSRGGDRTSALLSGGSKGWIYLAGIAVLAAAAAVVAAATGRLRGESVKNTSAFRGTSGQVIHDADAEPVEISIASFEPSLAIKASERQMSVAAVVEPEAAGSPGARAAATAAAQPSGRQEAEPLEISIAAFEWPTVKQADRGEERGAAGSVSSIESSNRRSSRSEERREHGGFRFPVNVLKHGAHSFSGLPGHKEDEGEGRREREKERGGEREREGEGAKHNVQTGSGSEGDVKAEGEEMTIEGSPGATIAEEEVLPLDVSALQVCTHSGEWAFVSPAVRWCDSAP